MIKLVSNLLFFIAVVCMAHGCSSKLPSEQDSIVAASQSQIWLEPVRTTIGVTGRSVLHCPAGECIILHYPPAFVDMKNLDEALKFNPDSLDDDAELYIDAGSRWTTADQPDLAINTFNCCTFAVGDVVGLTINDWLKPTADGDTYYTVPMQVILDSYFDRIMIHRRPIRDWEVIATDTRLQANDVVCFVDTSATLPAFSHAGKISKKDGQNLLVSKFGSGPIIRSTIKAMAVEYSKTFDQIWIYRVKHSAKAHSAKALKSPKA